MRLENHPTAKKPSYSTENLSKNKKIKIPFFSNSVSCESHSAVNPKEDTFWGFLTSILLQAIKKLKRGPFVDFKIFSRKSHKAEVT